ncbi:MAG: hypothetical protein LUQ69_10305 [Methanoregulaceae archaeon]|nr:hypothetical protein [Methanoregulaceae archaeon]
MDGSQKAEPTTGVVPTKQGGKALEATLIEWLVRGVSRKKISSLLGIDYTLLGAYLKSPEVRRGVALRRLGDVNAAIRTVIKALPHSIKALRKIQEDEDVLPADRVEAAKVIVAAALKMKEMIGDPDMELLKGEMAHVEVSDRGDYRLRRYTTGQLDRIAQATSVEYFDGPSKVVPDMGDGCPVGEGPSGMDAETPWPAVDPLLHPEVPGNGNGNGNGGAHPGECPPPAGEELPTCPPGCGTLPQEAGPESALRSPDLRSGAGDRGTPPLPNPDDMPPPLTAEAFGL